MSCSWLTDDGTGDPQYIVSLSFSSVTTYPWPRLPVVLGTRGSFLPWYTARSQGPSPPGLTCTFPLPKPGRHLFCTFYPSVSVGPSLGPDSSSAEHLPWGKDTDGGWDP